MRFDAFYSPIKVFLSEASEDVRPVRNTLTHVLQRAGMEVLSVDCPQDGEGERYRSQTREAIAQADCSIHLLGSRYDSRKLPYGDYTATTLQFKEVQARITDTDTRFKMFIWQPEDFAQQLHEPEQEAFVNQVRNTIYRNMIYSTRKSPVVFVEDVRSVMYSGSDVEYNIHDTELFIIYNEVDEDEAAQIQDLLSDVVSIEALAIKPNASLDYSEFIQRQSDRKSVV